MTDLSQGLNPQVPAETDAAIVAWMAARGWKVAPARPEVEMELGFHVWQEHKPTAGGSHALWVSESMVKHLSAEQLVKVLNSEDMGEEIRISLKVSIQERGDEYRVLVVSRRSGEWPRQE